ncbi:NAD(P)H-dependent oxidoreductase subunit E [Psychromonas aquimarina]|uniref:NADH-quinone oxidoreductase subunit NuoE family protein n=1 Tax=Psychromonas aquimarina TaxID=444919 RepID=UPI000408204A|nr:NAD(P)H-dependent oxidoreductase subunit E [Psychromonas aquimarina]
MFKEYDFDTALKVIEKNTHLRGGLVETLRNLADTFGYINEELYPVLADTFSQSEAGVLGVVSFYHDFKTKPRAKNVIKVCMAEGCYARKSKNMIKVLCDTLETDIGEKREDGEFEIEEVFCLGNCAVGPNIVVNDKLYAEVTSDNVKNIINKNCKGK